MRFAALDETAGGSEAALEPRAGQGCLLQMVAWWPPLPDEEALDFQSALCQLSWKGHFYFNPEKEPQSTALACPFLSPKSPLPSSAMSSTLFPLNCFVFGLMD